MRFPSTIRALLGIALALAALPSPTAAVQPYPEASPWVTLSGRLTNGGVALAGAALYLEPRSGVQDAPPLAPLVIDQEHLRFVPGSVVVTPATSVLFRNSDPVMHNIFSPGPDPFDLGTHARDETVSHRFRSVGIHVVLCNIHPEMVAYVSVVPSSWFAVVDDDGEFHLPAVPSGDYVLHVWVPQRRNRTSIPVRIDPAAPSVLDLVMSGGTLRVR